MKYFPALVVCLFSFFLIGAESCSLAPTASIAKVRSTDNNGPDRAQVAIKRNKPLMEKLLSMRGVSLDQPLLMRAFKQEGIIEVWAKSTAENSYKKVKIYPVCAYSGLLGPKEKTGDLQTPEGFYSIKPQYMNPNSSFHLSFDLGFPNRSESARGWTGTDLMVHGDCISEGCYAMTDDNMEELYTLAHMNFQAGHKQFDFHSFPFQMTSSNMAAYKDNPWHKFWTELKVGYDSFEASKRPPKILTSANGYQITSQ